MKTYAVYRSETGFYCLPYCATLDSLKGSFFEGIVQEEQLPVVLEGNGGYHHFTEDDFNFVKLLETDDDPPLSLEEMYFKNHAQFKLGWISPEGDTYSCNYTNHAACAIALAKAFFPNTKYPERTLGRYGWIKIIDSWNGIERRHGQFVYSMSGKITKKQADKLFDLGLYNKLEVRELIANSETNW